MKLLVESERKIGKNPFEFLSQNIIPSGSFVSIGYVNDHEISFGPKTRKKITPENDAELTAYLEKLPESPFKTALINFQQSDKYQASLLSNGTKTAPLVLGDNCHIVKISRNTVNWRSNISKFYADINNAVADVRVKHGFGKDDSEYAEDDWRRNHQGTGRYPESKAKGNQGNPYRTPIESAFKKDGKFVDTGFYSHIDDPTKIVIRQVANPRASRTSLWYFIDELGNEYEMDKNLMAFLMYASKSSSIKDEVKEMNAEEQAFMADLQAIKNIDKKEMTMALENILYLTGTSINENGNKEPFTWLNDDIISGLYPYINPELLNGIIKKCVKFSKSDLSSMNEGLVIKERKMLNESSKTTKSDKKSLYESIMKEVSKTIKKTLNESCIEDDELEEGWDSLKQTLVSSYGELDEFVLDCPILGPVTLIYDEDENAYSVYDEMESYLGDIPFDIVEKCNANDDYLENYIDEQFADRL